MRWKHLFSVAPMMEYTDTHQRFLMRLLTKQAVLYTEMVTANTICRVIDSDNLKRFLYADFPIEDHVVLQLGGSDITQMRTAAKTAMDYGYKEINLNVGCPSEKVAGKGCFGAALMLEPQLVADLCSSISEETNLPTTVKCRIGVNDVDSYESLFQFIDTVSSKAKVNHFVIHARKAILNAKFTPDDNRKIPPLKYDYVYKLLNDFPAIQFTINGGINTYDDIISHLDLGVHGVMVGRAVINDPFYWRHIDSILYDKYLTQNIANNSNILNISNEKSDLLTMSGRIPSRRQVMESYIEYAARIEAKQGHRSRTSLVKPILGLFTGVSNGRTFRRKIDELMRDKTKSIANILYEAMISSLDNSVLDEV